MKTLNLSTNQADIARAAQIIREGGLIAFPTETVYGLGSNALNADAVANIYKAKGRPGDNPMIVHITDRAGLEPLVTEITPVMDILMDEFWPGPLTIVMCKSNQVPPVTTGGLDTVAVRMPSNQVARQLIEVSGCAIAAPSANLSGKPSPTTAADVLEDMDGRIDGIIWGEDCQVGIESTVIDVSGNGITILRPGIITPDMITAAMKSHGLDIIATYDQGLLEGGKHQDADPSDGCADTDYKPKSPGMKYKHYAPQAEMVIYRGSQADVDKAIRCRLESEEASGKKVGVISFGSSTYDDRLHGEVSAEEKAAHDFFAKLRELDRQGCDLIVAGALNLDNQIGFAVMNRMFKSAGYNVIDV